MVHHYKARDVFYALIMGATPSRAAAHTAAPAGRRAALAVRAPPAPRVRRRRAEGPAAGTHFHRRL